jgi:hypothetical protein
LSHTTLKPMLAVTMTVNVKAQGLKGIYARP